MKTELPPSVGSFEELRSVFDYDRELSLDLEETSVDHKNGIPVHDFGYTSLANGRIPAYLVRPPGTGPFPAVIFVHPAPGSLSILRRTQMDDHKTWEPARNPEDLARFFVVRANAGDVEGLVALYEPGALLVVAEGQVVTGHDAIRSFYAGLLARRPTFQAGDQRPALHQGELALTSSRLVDGTVTAEVARQQPNGAWLWVIDQPSIAREIPGPV